MYVVVHETRNYFTGRRDCVLVDPGQALAKLTTIWNGGLTFTSYRLATGREKTLAFAIITSRDKVRRELEIDETRKAMPFVDRNGKVVYDMFPGTTTTHR